MRCRGAWDPAWKNFYTSKRCDAIEWTWRSRRRDAGLEGLASLPLLKDIRLYVRGVNDQALVRLENLEDLQLDSDCDSHLDLSRLRTLERAMISRPVDSTVYDGSPSLSHLMIVGEFTGSYRLPSIGTLKFLRLSLPSGPPEIIEITGGEGVSGVSKFWLDDVLPENLEFVGDFVKLRNLKITCRPSPNAHSLDLAPLGALSSLEHLSLAGCLVDSLRPLEDLPGLITVVAPEQVLDGNWAPLGEWR